MHTLAPYVLLSRYLNTTDRTLYDTLPTPTEPSLPETPFAEQGFVQGLQAPLVRNPAAWKSTHLFLHEFTNKNTAIAQQCPCLAFFPLQWGISYMGPLVQIKKSCTAEADSNVA
jgi:hypothetical protein